MGIDAISGFMKQFGFGSPTGIDLEHEKTGVLPSQEWKHDRFKGNSAAQKWFGGDTVSVSIGQGFNSYTMLQLANAVSTLANNGVIVKPHLVRVIEEPATHARTLAVSKESGRIPLKQENVDIVKRAMVGVTTVIGATGYQAFLNAPYEVGGKTGTAQVVGLKGAKYNPSTPERLRDHALFIAFAPRDKPRIAIADFLSRYVTARLDYGRTTRRGRFWNFSRAVQGDQSLLPLGRVHRDNMQAPRKTKPATVATLFQSIVLQPWA